MKWKRKRDPLDRLMDLLSEDDRGCWVHRSPDAAGYGRLGVGDGLVYAHRYVFERMVAEIPEGLVIDHLCRNRACANPSHLDAVPQRVNLMRGRQANREKASA